MKKEVLQAGLAEPQYEFTGFFTIIFSRSKVGEKVGEKVDEPIIKTKEKILQIIREKPEITAVEISNKLDISSRAVEKSIDQLKKEGILIRKGSKKTGYWEVISSE